MAQVLHGDAKMAYLDIDWPVAMKRGKLKALPEDRQPGQSWRRLETVKARIRSRVEPPFHFRKVRDQGRARNTAQLHPFSGGQIW